MEKRISYMDFQSVRSVAKAIDPKLREKESIRKKIEKLAGDYKSCEAQIAALEAGIVAIVGCHVTDLVKKVIEPGVDGKGNPTKTTKYLPTDIVSYDQETKQYIITLPDSEAPSEAPQAEETSEEVF